MGPDQHQVIVSELCTGGPVVVSTEPATSERTVPAQMAVPSGLATGTISKLIEDGATIEPVVVASGLAQPEGLDVAADGSLIVVETGAWQISQIDLVSG